MWLERDRAGSGEVGRTGKVYPAICVVGVSITRGFHLSFSYNILQYNVRVVPNAVYNQASLGIFKQHY
ncbi:hypothetical protein ACN38_g4545 [Penicillium nordicum]|uniref:Uncharacterized protein n=1 Tax=Penicillium nordicum TaxID=229535 RepID=A0A0M8P387_9EURO|nr:hypothetical protein ACN38_g4545 [Penicillium nordicum]